MTKKQIDNYVTFKIQMKMIEIAAKNAMDYSKTKL